jgi:acetyl esterase/lipase
MRYDYDPELAEIMAALPDMDLGIGDPPTARAGFSEMVAALNADLDATGVVVEERRIPGPEGAPAVAIRTYTPEGLDRAVPGLLQIHGGGFVIGDLEMDHGTCLALSRNLGIVVVSVGYRLAPETPYPGGLEDCYAALLWTSENAAELQIDPQRLGISGQSAGACLSTATAMMSRDRGGPALCLQYLGIPGVDDRLETPSMQKFVDTPLWNRPNAELSWDFYLGDAYRRGAENVPAYAAPARADNLANLPPTYISTMEFDPLRDEGVLYALRLMQAGVSVELHSFPGTFHGSSLFPAAGVSQRESSEMMTVLRRGLRVEDNR